MFFLVDHQQPGKRKEVKKPGLDVAKYPQKVKDFEDTVLSQQQRTAKR